MAHVSGGLLRAFRRDGTATAQWARYREDYRLHLLAEQGRTRATADTYVYMVGTFVRWCTDRRLPFVRATKRQVARYFAESLASRSRSTAVGRILALRSFYRWRGGSDPTADISARRPHVEPRQPYTKDELQRLLAATRSARDRALLLIFIGSGCRRAEVLAMRVDDIDWERGEIRIRGKGLKERRVAPGVRAMTALKTHLNGDAGAVWRTQDGRTIAGQRAYLNLQRIAQRAGVVNATYHRFRVTAANHLMAEGMALDELQHVLGHSDIKTTAHYSGYSAKSRALERQRALSLGDRL